MKNEQLEAWVLLIVDQVTTGHVVEDSRVEIKANWPTPKEAARRIAGHANAAGTDNILWIIGLDEKNGVVSVNQSELANWLPQVNSEFNGLSPSLSDLVVPTSSGSVVALLFDVSRRPYVIKNPVFGKQGGGPVSLEVPWRSGTAINSARREDLLRILVPRLSLPNIEILEAFAEVDIHSPRNSGFGRLSSDFQRSQHLTWRFSLKLYVTPRTSDLLVLPTHKAALFFALGSEKSLMAVEFSFFEPQRTAGPAGWVKDSVTVSASAGEAVFQGPGLVHVWAYYYEVVRKLPPNVDLTVTLAVSPAGSDLKTETSFFLKASGEQGNYKRRWEI